MVSTEPWREALAPEPLDYTEWDTGRLRLDVARLLVDKEFASLRQADDLERKIGIACFELVARTHREAEFLAGTTGVEGLPC